MKQNVKELIKRKGPLAENEVKDLLKAYGIRTTKYKLVKNLKDIENLELKFPVALKVCSNKILHKTDVGGVKLDIKDMIEWCHCGPPLAKVSNVEVKNQEPANGFDGFSIKY